MKYLALLRGINVGGKNKLPMAKLVEMFVAAKCGEVRHYIQSGNVVFSASPKIAAGIPKLVSSHIARDFGFQIPVVMRTSEQIKAVVSENPFLQAAVEDETLHAMFLADAPKPEHVAGLDARRSPPDEFIVRGQEIYLRLPNGAARSKLTNAYFDSRLKTTSTVRNWRTVNALLELLER